MQPSNIFTPELGAEVTSLEEGMVNDRTGFKSQHRNRDTCERAKNTN